MAGLILLAVVTLLYAGYNLFIKLSGGHVPVEATTTILATIGIQLAALFTSGVFLSYLLLRGGQVFSLSNATYFWAAVAGVCIGGAEIGYMYLFGGIGQSKPMDASLAIPTIVSGTIVIAMLFSYFVLKETIAWNQLVGSLLIVGGIIMFFVKGQVSV
ncbi:MAG: EamA family transporter [Rhizobiales bacterium]|nr:EamA family transporter [Hyphomicrobiales bacterium]NRB14517.1 EamA family transporter [Hyphomicrobiales bacterium]